MLAVDRRCFKGEDCHKFPEPCRLTLPPLGSPHDHYNMIALFYFLKFFVPLDATCIQAHTGENKDCLIYLPRKVARYSFSGPIPPKFEHKLRRHKQSFGKIATTVVLDKDENLL